MAAVNLGAIGDHDISVMELDAWDAFLILAMAGAHNSVCHLHPRILSLTRMDCYWQRLIFRPVAGRPC